MAREREARSHVRRRRRGCLTGCLTNLLLLLGLAALLFVGAHVLGFVTTDPQTGAPSITFENVGELPKFDLSGVKLPDMDGAAGKLWAYGVRPHGLTVKTLRAGAGEAVLVAADGYTLLLGGGSGTGALLCTQMLLSRVNRLSAAVAMGSEDAQIGALPLAMTMAAPQYLLYQDSQGQGEGVPSHAGGGAEARDAGDCACSGLFLHARPRAGDVRRPCGEASHAEPGRRALPAD